MDDIAEMMMKEKENYGAAKRAGKSEGRREGALAKQNEIAKNMLNSGMTINLISKFTGLTNNQILALK